CAGDYDYRFAYW
nr:immunoglobulin heavy chain junction region [Mus musculus]MBK4196880.1 immunoglobulin heavy chain junction region [Mus musculus]